MMMGQALTLEGVAKVRIMGKVMAGMTKHRRVG
jgi:hypothetical protein